MTMSSLIERNDEVARRREPSTLDIRRLVDGAARAAADATADGDDDDAMMS